MTIISNNCSGGAILHSLGMEFKTPTINLQILPEEFPRFCQYLKTYLDLPLWEYTNISEEHERYLHKMFGGIPSMPFGLLGDIIVCFQHYDTFGDAKRKWDERKVRIEWDNIGYIFHARGEEYKKEAEEFAALPIQRKLLLTQGFDAGGVRFDGEGFEAVNGRLRITTVYDYARFCQNEDARPI